VGDDLPGSWRPQVETVAGDARPEAGGRRVQFADQPSRSPQGQIGPGIGREPVPVPRLPARVVGDVAVDEGQDFPVAFDPSSRGAPSKPAASRCRRYSCTAGDDGPIGRSSRSPRRVIPLVIRPPQTGTSPARHCWWLVIRQVSPRPARTSQRCLKGWPVPGAQNAQIRTDYADIGLEFHGRAYRRVRARRMSAPPPPSVTAAWVPPAPDREATVSIPVPG